MKALKIQFKQSKLAELELELTGYWAKDEWEFSECPLANDYVLPSRGNPSKKLLFRCISQSLNTEIKYALKLKLEQGFSPVTLWTRTATIRYLTEWLNAVASSASSLLDRSLQVWELSLRSYLAEQGKLNEPLTPPRIDKNQETRQYRLHSIHITTFRQIYKVVVNAYDDRKEYEKEIWDLRKMGISSDPSKSSYKINFTKIKQPWLIDATQKFIRYSLSICSVGECQNRVAALSDFSTFLHHYHPTVTPQEIDRPLLIEYLSDLAHTGLKEGTRHRQIGCLRTFLELCTREGWASVPDKRFIYNEDFPHISRPQPRYISEEVMAQLNQHIEFLPPTEMRMVLVLQEAGMRIGELCRLAFDCLMQDAFGDWFLRYYQFKMKKEHSIPISKEVAAVIREQQEIVQEQFGKDFPYLFPNRKGQPMKQKAFTDALNRLSHEKNICDFQGLNWHFQSHQFRHTVGTRMINSGVPHHLVQRYLGHESPSMTSRYAQIHDQTMKEEFAKFKGKIVDVTGKAVEPSQIESAIAQGADPNEVDAQWLKRNIRAQALPNGLCTLPVVLGQCPYGANKCLSCDHFKTDTRYLNQHLEHLERTNKLIEWAEETPESRRSMEVLKENLPVQENLKRIISSVKEDGDETST